MTIGGYTQVLRERFNSGDRLPTHGGGGFHSISKFRQVDCCGLKKILKPAQVTVILPIYNEQSSIQTTFDAVLIYAKSHPNYDFIFVSDGSTDQTKDILERQIESTQIRQIYLLAYSQRAGKGYAVKQGIEVADGQYICFLDGDLAYSLDHLDLMIAKLADVDVVIGSRRQLSGVDRGPKPSRKVAGKIFNSLSKQILDLPYIDMQAGLKGFKKDAAKYLFKKQRLMGFSFDVEIIYLAKKLGYSVSEISATVSTKHSEKKSKVNLLLDSLTMLLDLFRVRWNDLMGYYD